MNDADGRNQAFVVAAVAIAVLALTGWSVWILSQPPCGPPGTSGLAHFDRWAPALFIVAELAVTSAVGVALKRTLALITVTLATVGGVAIVSGAAIDLLIAAQQGCFS